VEFEYDTKNLLYVRIDRKRKFLATVFLRALGLRGADEIIRSFYTVDKLTLKGGAIQWAVGDSIQGPARRQGHLGRQRGRDPRRPQDHLERARRAEEGRRRSGRDRRRRARRRLRAADVVDPSTGEVILEANEALEPRVISMAQEKNVDTLEIFFPERDETGPVPVDDAEEGSDPHARRGADRDLPPASVPAIRRPSTARGRCSRTCSSTRRSTTSRGSAG
jgi:DNA-directed RNA polymerase subunit beta